MLSIKRGTVSIFLVIHGEILRGIILTDNPYEHSFPIDDQSFF